MNRFIAVGILVLICITGQTQEYPKDYFQQPVDGKLLLSGNFGELRSDHFHSGLDFKTGGKIGAKIYASADGYIARIKISLSGFGKAIYIKHPNGYITVYGHLNHFSKDIESYVRKKQYERESFTIELFPKASELKVKKGEVIAFSGNTGGSAGPHLHYEVVVNGKKVNSQKLKLPSGKILKNEAREKFELERIKIDLKIAELKTKS